MKDMMMPPFFGGIKKPSAPIGLYVQFSHPEYDGVGSG